MQDPKKSPKSPHLHTIAQPPKRGTTLQGMELRNFPRGRHPSRAHHVGHRPTFYSSSFFIRPTFCLVPCGRLSWLFLSFLAHVNIVHCIARYRIAVVVDNIRRTFIPPVLLMYICMMYHAYFTRLTRRHGLVGVGGVNATLVDAGHFKCVSAGPCGLDWIGLQAGRQ